MNFGSVFFSALPVLVLIFLMTKPKPWPSVPAFGFAAGLSVILALFYWKQGVRLVLASILSGFLEAFTPVFIVAGAVFLFLALEQTGLMDTIRTWLRGISPHPIAQVMVVGWAFGFLIEGASGFGTPAALAAPILAGLGFPVLNVAAVCLAFNGICTIFGAVGTPIWFGFGPNNLSSTLLLKIGQQAAFFQTIVALIVCVAALRFLFPWKIIFRNLIFIWLSLLTCLIPMIFLSYFSYEFPVILGGAIGLLGTILLAKFQIGLDSSEAGEKAGRLWLPNLGRALLPLTFTVFVLLITRIPGLGLRNFLTSADPALSLQLGNFGIFRISATLVLQMRDILGQGMNWSFPVLYVPAILPFAFAAILAVIVSNKEGVRVSFLVRELGERIRTPWFALIGALILVKLMLSGSADTAPAFVIGRAFAEVAGEKWKFFASGLGSLGSFFSGSTTISNLTFGGTQIAIAESTNLPVELILALQLAGGSIGNMICLHNIIAVCAVLGLKNQEGAILRKTLIPWFLAFLLLVIFPVFID
ncbi:MAG: L-lactate permease [Chthoniobacterales bacterium]|nr:L-lactate permease [Chthoniobacterales bacterium]